MNDKQFKYIALILLVVLTTIGGVAGNAQQDFEEDMCNNLDVNSFDFDLGIEVSATTAKDCYTTLNHPLVRFGNILLFAFLGFLLSVLIIMFLYVSIFGV